MKKAIFALVALGMALQLVPLGRDNPPVVRDVSAPPAVATILRRACYDCHSNETRWPWYAYVAPVSFLVVFHVQEGREHLNFSDWARSKKEPDEILEEVEEGEMPMKVYLLTHPQANLSAAEVGTLGDWLATLPHQEGSSDREGKERDDHSEDD